MQAKCTAEPVGVGNTYEILIKSKVIDVIQAGSYHIVHAETDATYGASERFPPPLIRGVTIGPAIVEIAGPLFTLSLI